MVVAVERELENIKNHLENSGYQVVDAKTYRGVIDAYVYENVGLSVINEYNSFTQNSNTGSGILIINAKNKTPDEIISVLVNRVYGDNLNFL